LNFNVGDIFKWNNFPDPRIGTTIKPRWFIYLGETGYLSQIQFLYLSTTTTQIQDFQPGGKRSSHDKFTFKKSNFPFFEEDCIIDFDEQIFSVPKTKIQEKKDDIEMMGNLNIDMLRMIYKRLLKSPYCAPMVLNDIHESFNRAGITQLKKPKLGQKR